MRDLEAVRAAVGQAGRRAFGAAIVASALFTAGACFAPAFAQNVEEVFEGEGLRVEFPGWRQSTPEAGSLERLMEIRPVQMEPTFRACHIERAELPPQPGMAQILLNQRVRDSQAQYRRSPTYLEIGVIEAISVSETDGIAILDIVVRGTEPTSFAWVHDRMFVLVDVATGGGRYHRFSCIAMAPLTPPLAAEINAIMASLRFTR